MPRLLQMIEVRAVVGARGRGRLCAGRMVFDCAVGPAGIVNAKREGDRGTPRGTLPVRRVWRRGDRGPRTPTALPQRVIRVTDGWCDDPRHRRYNTPITLPFSASHERMWRNDRLYDLVVELGWNDRPPIPGRGSAIFMHVARPGLAPTEGCVAAPVARLRRLLARVGPKTQLRIGVPPRKVRAPVNAVSGPPAW